MDASKVSTGAMIAAGSGLALIIFLFLPWFGVSVQLGGRSFSESGSAWETLSVFDILLFLVGLTAIGVAVAKAAGVLPTPVGIIVLAAGVIALLFVLFRMIDSPAPSNLPDEVDVSLKIGIFLGLIASAGIAFGGYTLMNEER